MKTITDCKNFLSLLKIAETLLDSYGLIYDSVISYCKRFSGNKKGSVIVYMKGGLYQFLDITEEEEIKAKKTIQGKE